MFAFKILNLAFALNLCIQTSSTRENKQNNLVNQHLTVLWSRYGGEYNQSYVGPKKGGVMMEYLAARFRFSFSYLKVKEIYFYPVGQSKKGLLNYLVDGHCDILAHDILVTPEIHKLIEPTLPWSHSVISFVLPAPDHTANFDAIVKPFHWLVWLLIMTSIVAVTFFLKLTSRRIFQPLRRRKIMRKPRYFLNEEISRQSTWNIYGYVFGMLLAQGNIQRNHLNASSTMIRLISPMAKHLSHLSDFQRTHRGKQLTTFFLTEPYQPYQSKANLIIHYDALLGGPCVSRSPSTQILAGVWCCATFVLVQAYTSILFTYIVAPTISPLLINSVYDLVNKPEINMIVEVGRIFENTIRNTQDKIGVFKQLRDKLEAFPKSRCYNGPECVELVKKGPNIVLAQGYAYALDNIISDFKITGKCNLQLAKETFWPVQVSWGLPKKNSFTEMINRGILEMFENGLMDHWETWFRSIPDQCQGNIKHQVKRSKGEATESISLRNLTSAFILLFIGFGLSILAFVGEYVISFARNPHLKL